MNNMLLRFCIPGLPFGADHSRLVQVDSDPRLRQGRILGGDPAATPRECLPPPFVVPDHALADHFAGTVIGAPFCFTKNTTNLAGLVALAFRETVCTSSGDS
jgi:hypothetical protein